MASQAIEAINGLTGVTETANTLAKSASGVAEGIGKTLSTLVTNILQPLAPMFIYLLQQLYLSLTNFKKALDDLPKFIDENVFKPIAGWIDKYIVQPFWDGVQKIKESINAIGEWWDVHVKQPFDKTVKMVVDSILGIPKTISDFVSNTVLGIQKWWDTNLGIPFEQAKKDVALTIGQVVDLVKGFFSFGWLTGAYDKFLKSPEYKELVGMWDGIKNAFKSLAENEYIKAAMDLPRQVGVFVHNLIATAINAIVDAPGVGLLAGIAGLRKMELQSFETGGVVPGSGPQIAVVHGGERITPSGQSGGNTFNFYGYQDDKFIQKVKDVLRSQGTVYNL